MTKEEILKHYGIYPGFRSTYTYEGILSAMGDYAALIAAKPNVSGSLPLDRITGYLEQLHAYLSSGETFDFANDSDADTGEELQTFINSLRQISR